MGKIENMFFLFNLSKGKHLCSSCGFCLRHVPDVCMTTADINDCDYVRHVMYGWDGEEDGDLDSYKEEEQRLLSKGIKIINGKTGNDRYVWVDGELCMKTEDNGGGYDITDCRFYQPIGENPENEKDAKLFYRLYLDSDIWKKKRRERIEKDGFKCSVCGSAKNLNVHHITYERLGREDLEDLVTLCRDCHSRLHGEG